MKQFIKILKWIGIGIGTLALLYLAVALFLNMIFGYELRRTLREMKERGVPLTVAELIPEDVPDAENAAVILNEATAMIGNDADLQALIKIIETVANAGKLSVNVAAFL